MICHQLDKFALKSDFRVYGRMNAVRMVINRIKYLTITSERFKTEFTRFRIESEFNFPGHLIGQALTYLVNEGFLEKSPADKNSTFGIRINKHIGRLKWYGELKKWQFEYDECKPPTGRRTSIPRMRFFPQIITKSMVIPTGIWDESTYCILEESDTYKEFVNYIAKLNERNVCPKCGQELEVDRKHHQSKCKMNIVKGIMGL